MAYSGNINMQLCMSNAKAAYLGWYTYSNRFFKVLIQSKFIWFEKLIKQRKQLHHSEELRKSTGVSA